MRLVPIIALVDEDSIERLRPIIEQTTEHFGPFCRSTAALLNGWTPEAMAWGQIVRAASFEEIEVVREAPQD